MCLIINSPAHYTQEFGIDEDIYKMCSLLIHNIDVSTYTDVLDSIAISPMVAPVSVLENSDWRERKYISLSYRMADVALILDYHKYCNGDMNIKKKMIIENIIESLKVIKKRLKGKFNYEQMVQDIERIVSAI